MWIMSTMITADSYALQDSKPDFVHSLFLNFFAKTKAFVLIKLFL